jgi:hypothetical protein
MSLGFDYDDVPYFDHDRPTTPKSLMEPSEDVNSKFLDTKLAVNDRIEAARDAFLKSDEEFSAAIAILRNKEEEDAIRAKAASLSTQTSEAFLDAALEIIADRNESADLRSKLMHELRASERFSRHFHSRKPQFFDTLRGLIRSSDEQLRFQAIDILAAHDDEVVQEFLVEEIQKEGSALIPKPDAIFFLSQINKPQHARLFREQFEKSSDPEIRKAALEGLGNDPASADLLTQVVMDKSESFKVREAGALSLHHLDIETMNSLAAELVVEKTPEVRNMLLGSPEDVPDPDEVSFKASLLNMLAFTARAESLNDMGELKSTLRGVVAPGDVTAKLLRSATPSAESIPQSPQIIEQLAAKLLRRIEKGTPDK